MSKWLTILAEHYGKEISSVNAAIYERALTGLSPEQLERACIAALQDCRFMPTVADILMHAERGKKLLDSGECDREWTEILGKVWAWDDYYQKWGCDGPPALSGSGQYAVRCCGGFSTFRDTKPEHLPLLRKQFVEFYNRMGELAAQGVLSDGQAKKILGKVQEFAKLGDGKAKGEPNANRA